MKKTYSILLIVLMTFLHQAIFSQTTLTISNLSVSGSAIPPNASINMSTNATVQISFHVDFTKPNNVDYSNTAFVISGYNSFGIEKQLTTVESFNLGINNTGFSGNYSIYLNATDFDFSEGSYLRANLTQTSGNPPLEWHSNQVKIIKTPTYAIITQTPANITCGSNSPITFQITSNDPNNYSSYQWSYNSSWYGNYSITNQIQLNPTTYPLGIISVIPTIHGSTQGIFSFNPVLAPLTSAAIVSGNTVICPGNNSIYTISNVGTGNTVTWSSSNTAIATVSGGTQSQVTVNGLTGGAVTLNATITNSCGQTTTKTRTIYIGSPVLANGYIYGEVWVRKAFVPVGLTFAAVPSATSYVWTVIQDPDVGTTCPTTGALQAKFSNNLTTMTTTTTSITASFGNCLGGYIVTCRAVNACGSTDAYIRYVTVGNSGTNPCSPPVIPVVSNKFVIAQNPIKNGELKIIPTNNPVLIENTGETTTSNFAVGDTPCFIDWPKPYVPLKMNNNNNFITESSEIEVKIYNMLGKQVYFNTIKADSDGFSIKDTNLSSGKYILHILQNNTTEKQIIVVE